VTTTHDDLRLGVDAALVGSIGRRRIQFMESRPCPERSSFSIDEIDEALRICAK
jgi:hypothetical protein